MRKLFVLLGAISCLAFLGRIAATPEPTTYTDPTMDFAYTVCWGPGMYTVAGSWAGNTIRDPDAVFIYAKNTGDATFGAGWAQFTSNTDGTGYFRGDGNGFDYGVGIKFYTEMYWYDLPGGDYSVDYGSSTTPWSLADPWGTNCTWITWPAGNTVGTSYDCLFKSGTGAGAYASLFRETTESILISGHADYVNNLPYPTYRTTNEPLVEYKWYNATWGYSGVQSCNVDWQDTDNGMWGSRISVTTSGLGTHWNSATDTLVVWVTFKLANGTLYSTDWYTMPGPGSFYAGE